MGTASGYAAFLDPEVNVHLKKILNEWGKFLMSPKSADVLGEHNQGWFRVSPRGEHVYLRKFTNSRAVRFHSGSMHMDYTVTRRLCASSISTLSSPCPVYGALPDRLTISPLEWDFYSPTSSSYRVC